MTGPREAYFKQTKTFEAEANGIETGSPTENESLNLGILLAVRESSHFSNYQDVEKTMVRSLRLHIFSCQGCLRTHNGLGLLLLLPLS